MIDPQKFLPNKPYVYVLRSQKDAGTEKLNLQKAENH
jgi:hypothetical protein